MKPNVEDEAWQTPVLMPHKSAAPRFQFGAQAVWRDEWFRTARFILLDDARADGAAGGAAVREHPLETVRCLPARRR